jgi:hypothetical protein
VSETGGGHGRPAGVGRVHAGKTVTIDVTDTELIVACDDGPPHRPAHEPQRLAVRLGPVFLLDRVSLGVVSFKVVR